MSIQRILAAVRSLDGVLVLSPTDGDGSPELAWGDHFVYYAPDGTVPTNVQPYATIVTKNYPDDTASDLDRPGRWRLNIHVGRATSARLLGDGVPAPADATDVLLPHPVYGRLGWIAVVDPGERTLAGVLDLLADAHERAKVRAARRG
ncbi:MAG TPA: DUF6194 family protein [Actinocatenispora sp.]